MEKFKNLVQTTYDAPPKKPRLYKNKYRVDSHRRPNWDYSADALYFLTIVTQHRICNLGEIIGNGIHKRMELSDFGKIVEQEWFKSFEIRNELFLHESIIMPNHIHAIVEINNNNTDTDTDTDSNSNSNSNSDTVDTHGRAYQRYRYRNQYQSHHQNSPDSSIPSIKRNHPIRLPKSISSFIAGFKSAVNTKIDDYIDEHQLKILKYNRNNHFFQPNYHDHIIRNNREYFQIKNYIINNPKNWNNDRLQRK